MPSWTSSRLAQTQVWPALRYFDCIAPSTAASRSASSKTMKGALPPSSRDSFLTVGAHCAISRLPTSVEPVKDSLRTLALAVSSPPMAAGGQSRRGLARDHRRREIPRRDGGADADRFLDDDEALVGLLRRNDVAIYAAPLLGEPVDESGGVADFAARFGERLALFAGHQHGQVVLVGQHQVVPTAQNPRPLAGGPRAPGGQGGRRGGDGAARLGGAHLRHHADEFAVSRVEHAEGLAVVGIDPGAVDAALAAQQRGVLEQHDRVLLRPERPAARRAGTTSVPAQPGSSATALRVTAPRCAGSGRPIPWRAAP